MTITLTKPAKSQWAKIGKVILWLAVSALCAGGLALITKKPDWLASLPAWNVLGVFVQQILTQEEQTALDNVPEQIRAEAAPIEQSVATPSEPPSVPVA